MSLSSSASTARALRPSLAVMVVWPSRCSMSSSSCRLTALSSTTSTRPAPGCGAVLPSARARKAMATALNCASRAGILAAAAARSLSAASFSTRPLSDESSSAPRLALVDFNVCAARRAASESPLARLRATTKGGPTPPSVSIRSARNSEFPTDGARARVRLDHRLLGRRSRRGLGCHGDAGASDRGS